MSELTDLETKRCCSCEKEKSIDLFHTDRSKSDGKYPACKDCKNKGQIKSYRKNIGTVKEYKKRNKEKIAEYHKDYQVDYYSKNKEKVQDRCKAYQKTDKGKAVASKAYDKWVKNNPKKAKARNIVYREIEKGTLKRLNCEVCGCEKTQGHHKDYNEPLEVMWLCAQHHKDWHKINGEGKNG